VQFDEGHTGAALLDLLRVPSTRPDQRRTMAESTPFRLNTRP
jgi:hypothetical protein